MRSTCCCISPLTVGNCKMDSLRYYYFVLSLFKANYAHLESSMGRDVWCSNVTQISARKKILYVKPHFVTVHHKWNAAGPYIVYGSICCCILIN